MRDWRDWLQEIAGELYNLLNTEAAPIQLRRRDCNRLLEIELVITLHEQVYGNPPDSNLKDAWSLLTGFIPSEIQHDPDLIHKVWIVRHRARYLRTVTAWNRALEWYEELPASIRLFEVCTETETYRRKNVVHYVPQRVNAIQQALSVASQHQPSQEKWAIAGQEYAFYLGVDIASVVIPQPILAGMEALTANLAPPTPPRQSPRQEPPPPLTIRLADLRIAALALEEKLPERNWLHRFEQLQRQLHCIADQLEPTDTFTIDGAFHLLGPTGAGKSTLIYLLVYHLCTLHPNFRIGIVANTVVDAIDMAADFVRMGVTAAPILGRDRDVHRYQYGMAKADELSPELLMQPYDPVSNSKVAQLLDNPALPWLTGICILSGLMGEKGIPVGKEPCYSLALPNALRRREQDHSRRIESYTCPFLPVCPVHRADRELVAAQVWVATPASLLYTYMPSALTRSQVRTLDAIYHYCDLLIVDEADRVQVSLEDRFAPSNDLSGNQRAILDYIDITLAERDFRQGRSNVADRRYRELRGVAREANRLTTWLFALLLDHRHLQNWAEYPLYNSLLYNELIDNIRTHAPEDIDPAALEQALERLATEFEAYYRFAPEEIRQQAQSGLEDIVSDVRSEQGDNLFKALRGWLEPRIPFTLDDSPESQRLLERLGFAIVLSAMDRYVNDLLRYWLSVNPDLGEGLPLSQSPPDEFIDLVVESPLGNLLGYQFQGQTDEKIPQGVLRYLNCYGLGRYLLLRFPYLYQPLTGQYGPHTLLTSATSWAPGSPQFHIGIKPQAILVPPADTNSTIVQSQFNFLSVPDVRGESLRVSGRYGEKRYESLIQLVRYLAFGSGGAESSMEKELLYWQSQGQSRAILLLTGSYREAEAVANVLQNSNQWRDRVDCLQSDRSPDGEDWLLRRGQTEQFPHRGKPVLVAPLGSIQRGYNILDPETKTAFLGSVYFLVRPFPNPTDAGRHIRAINRWCFEQVMVGDIILPEVWGQTAREALRTLRQQAYSNWAKRLRSSHLGANDMKQEFWLELLWDQVVAIVQVLGRATRGNVPIRVYFCDAAFYPSGAERSLLKGWVEILDEYLAPDSEKPIQEQQLARVLYGSIYNRLSDLTSKL